MRKTMKILTLVTFITAFPPFLIVNNRMNVIIEQFGIHGIIGFFICIILTSALSILLVSSLIQFIEFMLIGIEGDSSRVFAGFIICNGKIKQWSILNLLIRPEKYLSKKRDSKNSSIVILTSILLLLGLSLLLVSLSVFSFYIFYLVSSISIYYELSESIFKEDDLYIFSLFKLYYLDCENKKVQQFNEYYAPKVDQGDYDVDIFLMIYARYGNLIDIKVIEAHLMKLDYALDDDIEGVIGNWNFALLYGYYTKISMEDFYNTYRMNFILSSNPYISSMLQKIKNEEFANLNQMIPKRISKYIMKYT